MTQMMKFAILRELGLTWETLAGQFPSGTISSIRESPDLDKVASTDA
jgi:hypothetical protein